MVLPERWPCELPNLGLEPRVGGLRTSDIKGGKRGPKRLKGALTVSGRLQRAAHKLGNGSA